MGRRIVTVRAAVLAIDGGNSKTDVALVAVDGTLLASARGPGSSPHHVGIDGCLSILAELVNRVAGQARLDAARDAGAPVAEYVEAYLAGADLPVEQERLQRAVHERRWGRHTRVGNDVLALLRAGAPRHYGVAVVCGAGINAVGRAQDGRIAGFPALGRISGDWGGGHDIGEEVLWWAARSHDGRGPRSNLEVAAAEHFGVSSVADLWESVHLGRMAWSRLSELTPVLFAVAAGGDRVARGLVDRLAAEVATMALVLLRRLGLADAEADVVLGGGVLAAGHHTLIHDVEARITAAAPRARVLVTTAPPVLGAALLGLDRAGAGAAAEARIRDSLREAADAGDAEFRR